MLSGFSVEGLGSITAGGAIVKVRGFRVRAIANSRRTGSWVEEEAKKK